MVHSTRMSATCKLCEGPATGKEHGGFLAREGTTVHVDCMWDIVVAPRRLLNRAWETTNESKTTDN